LSASAASAAASGAGVEEVTAVHGRMLLGERDASVGIV
jgi:hypothetical protein